MDYKKVELQIRKFHECCLTNESIIEQFGDIFDINPESKFFQSQYEIIGGYIEAMDCAYHIGGWLEWWLFECHLGKTKLKAKLPTETERSIEYLDDFVKLVIDDLKQNEGR